MAYELQLLDLYVYFRSKQSIPGGLITVLTHVGLPLSISIYPNRSAEMSRTPLAKSLLAAACCSWSAYAAPDNNSRTIPT